MTKTSPRKPKRCYLFVLEVQPLELGAAYETMPLHCTFMHRFLSEMPFEMLADKVRPLFAHASQVKLIPREYVLLGPNQTPVSELALTKQMKNLHMELYALLNDLRVEYTAPQWVGEGYRPHVTERENARLEVGSEHMSASMCLIEVEHPQTRIVRHTFALKM